MAIHNLSNKGTFTFMVERELSSELCIIPIWIRTIKLRLQITPEEIGLSNPLPLWEGWLKSICSV